ATGSGGAAGRPGAVGVDRGCRRLGTLPATVDGTGPPGPDRSGGSQSDPASACQATGRLACARPGKIGGGQDRGRPGGGHCPQRRGEPGGAAGSRGLLGGRQRADGPCQEKPRPAGCPAGCGTPRGEPAGGSVPAAGGQTTSP